MQPANSAAIAEATNPVYCFEFRVGRVSANAWKFPRLRSRCKGSRQGSFSESKFEVPGTRNIKLNPYIRKATRSCPLLRRSDIRKLNRFENFPVALLRNAVYRFVESN